MKTSPTTGTSGRRVLMGELLDDAVEQLARLVGVAPGELSDEHARWVIYLKGIELPVARNLLHQAVSAETDDNLAASVVLRMIERIREDERAEWVDLLRGEKRNHAHRRALEMSILERILSGAVDSTEVAQKIDGWTDWLQLRVAYSAIIPEVLDIVAEAGRTRRIRNAAKARQHEAE